MHGASASVVVESLNRTLDAPPSGGKSLVPIRTVRPWLALLALLLAVPRAGAQPVYDLLLKGGHVIDPRNRIDAVMDVAIAGGKVAQPCAPNIDPAQARDVVDVSGLYVTPGLIDIHVHVFATTRDEGRLGR